MKLLLVAQMNPFVRSVAPIHHYVATGRTLGHEVVVFGDPQPDLPALPFTTDLAGVDLAMFVVQTPSDFPDMPRLAHVLDAIPRERRIVVDLWGRFNETIRVDHDFNHLEKLDGHQGWEWIETLQSVSNTIAQPTLTPLRADARSFLFHGYDPGSVARPYESARHAAEEWRRSGRRYGVIYVGNNWQRWDQVRRFLNEYDAVRQSIGPACLVGWDWDSRPEWAVHRGIMGVNTDPRFLSEMGVEARAGVRFEEVVGLLGQARFVPVFHRPLFQHLGFVTNRTFETFCADSLPVLMLPRGFVEAIYGPAAVALIPNGDLGAHLRDALEQPERAWDAVLRTRTHLARHHSFARRFQELQSLLDAADAPSKRGVP